MRVQIQVETAVQTAQQLVLEWQAEAAEKHANATPGVSFDPMGEILASRWPLFSALHAIHAHLHNNVDRHLPIARQSCLVLPARPAPSRGSQIV